MTHRKLTAFAVLLLLLGSVKTYAVEVASLFSDHMVLQRDAPVPIWGTASDGDTVVATFAGQNATAKCENGKWRIELKPLAASAQPQTLSISVGDEQKIAINDVLVGEVWVGSGQSNMAGQVARYANNDPKLAELVKATAYPNIRLLRGGPKPTWTIADQQNVGNFSALCFAFGERLQRELDVPVGLMVGAVGGTPSGSWIPAKRYEQNEACQQAIKQFASTYDAERAKQQYEAKLAAWEKGVAKAKAAGKKPRGRKPSAPQGPGTSSRGGKIGGLFERHIQSMVGYRIAGVLWDQGEARSGVVGVDQYTMMSALIDGWRQEWNQGDFPFVFVQKPSGGGNAISNDNPMTNKADKFVAALPDANVIKSEPRAGGEMLDRFMYVRLMQDNSNAWMVPASDLGSGIHPTNKWGYGNRAAEVALSQVYKTGIQAYGPIYRSHTVEGNKLILQFDHASSGLTVAHSKTLQGFAVSDENQRWHWANAKIDGERVVVWSDDVKNPTKVSYAYADKRPWANLFNNAGLPALAFQADVSR